MRNSSLLKWKQNNKNNAGNKTPNGKTKGEGKKNKKWIHSPETLVQGHVAYLVKFLGHTEVDKPKGIEVVKQGVQKLKFNQQLKKSEGSNKTPKVELTISVEGVAIQEPKTKNLLHKYPLHKISYCADDKAEKRFFSFIAKEGDTNAHTCFVFVSDKLAEEITLTIGQAFELAYKKFLDTNGKDLETQKQMMVMQKRIALLEGENAELKQRLRDVAAIKGQADIADYLSKNNLTDIAEIRSDTSDKGSLVAEDSTTISRENSRPDELINLDSSITKLDGFSLDDINDDDFNPRASSGSDDEDEADDFDPRIPAGPPPALAPPPSQPPQEPVASVPNGGGNYQQNLSQPISPENSIFPKDDPFGQNPFSGAVDPFGMASFNSNSTKGPLTPLESTFQSSLAAGGPTTFSLDDLDPLKK